MRKIHLFDIPLYHPDGFKHVGDRKIRLYDPVDAVIAASDVAAPAAAATAVDAGATAAATGGIDLGGGIGISADGSIVGGTAGAVGDTASLDTMLGQTAAGTGTAASTVDGLTTSANTTGLNTNYSLSPTTGSSPVGQMSMSSLTNSLSPNYVPEGLQVSGAVAPASNLFGATMGGAQGLMTDLSALPSIDAMDAGVAPGTGTLSQSGVTSSIANPITDPVAKSGFNLSQALKQQAISTAFQKILQPFPSSSTSGSGYAPSSNSALNNNPTYNNTPSAPLTITPLFTGTPSSSGMFLSPLNTAGLSANQINSLYTPSGLGDTTTPNLLAASAVPSGGIFPAQQRYSGFKEGGSTHKPEFMTGVTGHYAQGRGTGQSDDIPALLKDGDYVMDADIVAALGDGSNKAGAEALHHFMHQFPHKHYENHSEGGHINAMIADGEFVFPASLVTALGGGSNKEGAKKLDEMREKIREHKRSASANKIPPKAKSPLSYMEGK